MISPARSRAGRSNVCDGPVRACRYRRDAEIILEGDRCCRFRKRRCPKVRSASSPAITRATRGPAPVMQVEAAHHRNDPILLGSPPMKPPRFHFGLPFRAASIWSNLETAGVTDVVGAWQHVSQLMTVVALRAALRRTRQARRADRGREQLHGPGRRGRRRGRRSVRTSTTSCGRSRRAASRPSRSTSSAKRWSSALDPRIPPERRRAARPRTRR